MKIHRINTTKRWSDVTIFNQIATFTEIAESNQKANIKGQTEQIFKQAEETLALIDSDKSKILSVTIYISDFSNIDELNEVWDEWFIYGTAPSRACVQAKLINSDLLVEMSFTAVAGDRFK